MVTKRQPNSNKYHWRAQSTLATCGFVITSSLFWGSIANAQPSAGAESRKVDTELAIRVGVGYSDNVERDSTDGVETAFGTIGLAADLEKEYRLLLLNLSSNLDYIEYEETGIDSEPIGSLDALLMFTLAQDLLSWSFEDSYGSIRTSFTEPSRPGNRETVNVFSTGPTLTLPLSDRSRLFADYRYDVSSYEESSRNDSYSHNIRLQISRGIASGALIGLEVAGRQVGYEDPSVPDPEIIESSLSYTKRLAKGNLDLNIGWNEVSLGDQFKDTAGLLYRLSWSHDITSRTNFSLTARQEFSDASELFQAGRLDNINIDRGVDVATAPDPLERQEASLSISSRRDRMNYSLSLSYSQDNYEQSQELDSETQRVSAAISRRISNRSRLGLSAQYEERDFDNSDRRDNDFAGEVYFNQDIGKQAEVSLTYNYFNRGRTATIQSIQESTVRLNVAYEFL